MEVRVLELVNERRAEGANCGAEGDFPPAGPLAGHASLRCAARVHSKDMVERGYFSHYSPEGEGPNGRIEKAGYGGFGWGENIAYGNSTAEQTVEQWMNSDPHCSNIMNASFLFLGVGYDPGGGQYSHMWTQAFGG
ncbi:MAG: CAP domain-containing protein [Myxococcales bacterium FL481]|nr:MAG: CAP domain-containing protein [Myxococcales bacterium FL481]